MIKKYKLRDFDFKLVIMILMLSGIGVMAISSAEEGLRTKQLAGVVVGFFIMIGISVINYNFVLKFAWPMYFINIGLLAAVILTGELGGGAQRWFRIGGLRFQPSETAKILLILFFAQFIMKYKEKLNTFKIIVACIGLILLPWVMIYKQPDLSTSVVVLVVFCVIMYSGGISYKVIFGAMAIVLPVLIIVIALALKPESKILEGFQKNRMLAFINPEEYATEEAYQQLNSVKAIGSGMLTGKGYKNNEITSVKNGNFLSEAQTDFIFAVIGEEFGFRGSVVVISLIFLISLECLTIARRSKDLAGQIIAAGIGSIVAFQGFFNIGVATFILPNTGLPLPFVSNGLTSLISLYIGMGFVLNVRLQAKKNGNTVQNSFG